MKCKEYDQKILDKLHQTELEIMDEFVRICDKYNLEYLFQFYNYHIKLFSVF